MGVVLCLVNGQGRQRSTKYCISTIDFKVRLYNYTALYLVYNGSVEILGNCDHVFYCF